MPFNPLTHFVLVDFENRPDIDLAPLAGHPVTVTLLLGEKSKLKAGLVEQITKLPFEVRLIKVGVTGKNALDFVLTFHLGEMVARSPRAHYHVVSGDKDFEPLIAHLKANHFHITRHNEIAGLPFLASKQQVPAAPLPSPAKVADTSKSKAPFKPSAEKEPPAQRLAQPKTVAATKPVAPPKKSKAEEKTRKLIAHLKLNHPKTQTTLRRSIATFYGNKSSAAEIEDVIEVLKKRAVLSIDGEGKVGYG